MRFVSTDVGARGDRGSLRPFLGSLLLVVTAALVLAGCAAQAKPQKPAAASVPPGTATVTFHAYTPKGRLAVPVAQTARGECWTTSIAAPKADAFRCFQGEKILDPCFAPAHPTTPATVACVADPWAKAVMLRIIGPLPRPSDGAASRPWALALADGTRCVASTGTVPAVHGVNLTYTCAGGGNAEPVAGSTGAFLTARYAAPGARTLQTVKVTTIWRT